MLHLIFKSPLESAVLQRMGSGDAAVFLNAAVYNLLKNSAMSAVLSEQAQQQQFYALAEDLSARGIQPSQILPEVALIDYRQMVDLTVAHSPIQSWF
jgi:tRNA 2-thiouridine synthesizing protein B